MANGDKETKKLGKKKIQELRNKFQTEKSSSIWIHGRWNDGTDNSKVGNEFRVTMARPEGRASHAFKSDPDKVDETINSYRVVADVTLSNLQNQALQKWQKVSTSGPLAKRIAPEPKQALGSYD
ncbi:MAG: hypothetical protein CM15mV33_460 [uncultured marine virus]|nr:MAG: hypothetical protein CM15mV33_460 [uncultured marine virus]